MLSKNQMSMFLKTQMLCIIANETLMPFVLKVVDFRLHSQTKVIQLLFNSYSIEKKKNWLMKQLYQTEKYLIMDTQIAKRLTKTLSVNKTLQI